MTRLKLAELTSEIGALVLGVDLGALFARWVGPAAGFVTLAGVLVHAFGMWDKHRLGSQIDGDRERMMPGVFCVYQYRPKDPFSTARILVAEHDADARAVYRELFQDTGADVVEAADGRETLVSALGKPPDLLFTDLRLPLLDGSCMMRRFVTTTTAALAGGQI